MRMYGRILISSVFGRLQVGLVLAVRVLAQVGQRDADHLARRVEHRDAAVLELGGLLRIEHEVPAVDRRVRVDRLDLALVVADAGGAPHVVHRVLVARVVQGDALEDLGIEVAPVR